jgi:hypothetical protein
LRDAVIFGTARRRFSPSFRSMRFSLYNISFDISEAYAAGHFAITRLAMRAARCFERFPPD